MMHGMGSHEIEVLERFYAKRREALFTYALSQVGCPAAAEDVVHGVFERLLQQRRLPENLAAYIFRALRNAATDLHRGNGHAEAYRAIFHGEVAAEAPDLGVREEAETLLAELTPDERECVLLKVYSGLTFSEIAAVRGVSVNTAASWYRRALEKMRTTRGKAT